MTCRIKLSLLSEHVDGDIGDDWKYSVEARLPGQAGSKPGRIVVAPHKIKPGTTHELPEMPSTDIEGGPCGSDVELELHLLAAEMDWILSDIGEETATIGLKCPGPGAPSEVIDREVAVRVTETPLVLGGSANLILKLRIEAVCEQSA
jgi:hypothetical protein